MLNDARIRNITTNVTVLSVLIIAGLRKICDYDIWYHLVIGREINATMHIPAVEFYIYPLLGQATSYHEWGFALLFYKGIQYFGYIGMSALNALISAGTLFSLYRAADEPGNGRQVNLIMLCVAFLLTYFRMVYRPEMMLFLAIAAEIYLLEKYAVTRKRKLLLPIPVIAFALGLFHPSVLFLLFVYGCYAVQLVVDEPRAWKSGLAYPAAILAASLALALVNPYGANQLLLPLQFVSQKEMLQQNFEFLPMMQTGLRYYFLAFCLASLIALTVKGNRKVSYALLYLVFGYLSFKYQRNFALLVITCYVPTVRGYRLILENARIMRHKAVRVSLWTGTFLLIVWCVAAKTVRNANWGSGVADGMFPEKAAEFILRNRPQGRIFNYYNLGGYLGWRLYKDYLVSIDGRHYSFDRSFQLHDKVFWDCDDWDATLREWGVNTVVVPATSKIDPQPTNLLYPLDASREWVLVSDEPSALVFVRKEEADRMKGVHPLNKDLIWEDVIRDSFAAMNLYNEHDKAYLSLAIAYFNLHNFPESLRCFRLYKGIHPQFNRYDEVIALLEGNEAGVPGALTELETLLKTSRNL